MGSNVNPAENIAKAIELISNKLDIVRISKYYKSQPVDARGGDFINVGILIHSDFNPQHLKYDILRLIEKELGRVRDDDKNAPRSIDLDIVFFGGLICDDEYLKVPDPDFMRYSHVALPIGELSDDFVHPVNNERIKKLAEEFKDEIGKSIHIIPNLDNL